MASLPFSINGVFTDLVDLEGIARLEGSALVLEFKTRHPLSNFIKSQAKEIRIPLDDLEEATFKRRWFRGALKIRARRLEVFSTMPGSSGGELKLECKKAHFSVGEEIASRISMRAVTQGLKEMIDANRPADEKSPGRANPQAQR